MAIVTISKGAYARGAQLAERVAGRLGYRCVAREILLEASRRFDIPEARLVRAVADSPSILDRITKGRQRYVAYVRAALLNHCRTDRVVYHGFAGQCFLAGVSHALKVRVVADLEDRIAIVMVRDGVGRERARATIQRDDRERLRWSQHLHGIDICRPEAYDMVLRIGKLSLETATNIVCDTAARPELATTEASQRRIDDLALAASVHAALIGITADVAVTASAGDVTVKTVGRVARLARTADHIRDKGLAVPGVREVKVESGLVASHF